MTATEHSLYSEYGRTLIIRAMDGEDTQELFDRVCSEFENTRIEQDSEGNVLIMAPTGGESSYQNLKISTQLSLWAERDGRGRAFDSGVLFTLPDGSRLGPDGSWVSNDRLKTLTLSERRKYLRVVPEFVLELKSPSDRISDLTSWEHAQDGRGVKRPAEGSSEFRSSLAVRSRALCASKMESWMRNGVETGWLINPDEKLVLIYRQDHEEIEHLEQATAIHGDGPVAGFVLDLTPVWQGLRF